jgi:hypothetical protein
MRGSKVDMVSGVIHMLIYVKTINPAKNKPATTTTTAALSAIATLTFTKAKAE